jgi:hypothetical protein
MRAYVSEVIEPEVYAELSNEELMELIEKGLNVDEGTAEGEFHSDHRAEYLERAMYVCPYCGLSEFESNGNETECKKCHRKITYGEDKTLTEWCEIYNIDRKLVYDRLERDWDEVRAITTPKRKGNYKNQFTCERYRK